MSLKMTSVLALTLFQLTFAATVVAEVAPDGGAGYATLVDKINGRCLPAQRDRGPEGRYQASSYLGAFVDVLDLADLELVVEDAEIELLDGGRLDGSLTTTVTGGISFGVGGRLWSWIRLPEITLTLGGASFESGWTRLDGQQAGLSVRPTSVFVFRFEVAAGIDIPLPRVRPYIMGRAAGSVYVVSADVREERLGALGEEQATDGRWELGTEAGLSILLTDGLALNIGWRATWYGVRGQGVSIALVGSRGL